MIILFFLLGTLQAAPYNHILSQFVIVNRTDKELLIKNYYAKCNTIVGDNDSMFFGSLRLDANQNCYKSFIKLEIGKGFFSKKLDAEISIPLTMLDNKVRQSMQRSNYLQISLELKKQRVCTFLPRCYSLISKEPGIVIRLI